jgi:hypothetical protein
MPNFRYPTIGFPLYGGDVNAMEETKADHTKLSQKYAADELAGLLDQK